MGGNVLLDFAKTFDDKKLLILFAIVVSTILIDSEIAVVSDLSETISSYARVLLFVSTAIIFDVIGFFILSYIKQMGMKGGAKVLCLNFEV